jgi:hypothetical protein
MKRIQLVYAVALCCALAIPAETQDVTAVVVTAAPIYIEPDASRVPLRTAAVNTTLQVVEDRGDWLKVEFQDPQYGRSVGFVQTNKIRVVHPERGPMDLSVAPSTPAVAAGDSTSTEALSSSNGQMLTKTSLLRRGSRVYVLPIPGKDFNEDMETELTTWSRWTIVKSQSEADIVVRMDLSGSGLMGRGGMMVSILPAAGGPMLWQSKAQTGNRTVFHGYASPYRRALEGIMKQMKEASEQWPQ